MKTRKNIVVALLLAMFAVSAFPASDANAGYIVKQSWARISAVAGEAITAGELVSIKDADGEAYAADANDAALRPAVGIAGKSVAEGDYTEIVVIGVLDGWTTLSEGAPAYLSETAGAVTQVAPTYAQQVGVAISATEYYINCQNYLDTSAVTALGVLSGASPLILEGATANDFETTLAVTDATADRTVTLADAGGTVMLSSLATNGADAANAVTGTSNGILFEGATADAHETTLSPTDPTADRAITLPNAAGMIAVQSSEAITATSDGVAASLLVLTSIITTNGDADLDNVTLADGVAGQIKIFTVSTETAGGDSVKVTPANLNGGTQITFDGAVGDGCIMLFDGTNWNIVANNGGTIA